MKRIRLPAYFTVEAAYVFPALLCVLFCGMYLCFHCYNSVSGVSILYEQALDIFEAGREGQDSDVQVGRESTARKLDDVLLYARAEAVDINRNQFGCSAAASYETAFRIPGGLTGQGISPKRSSRKVFWCDTNREQIRRQSQCIKLLKVQN